MFDDRRNIMKALLTASLIAAAFVFTAGCDGTGRHIIAGNGKSDYAIVLSDEASPSENHAAEELRFFIREATGAVIPIVGEQDSRAREPRRIFIGSSSAAEGLIPESKAPDWEKLGDEGFAIRTVTGKSRQEVLYKKGSRKAG